MMTGFLLLSLLAASPAAEPPAQTTRVLRFGTDTRQPPWGFVPGQSFTGEDFQSNPRPLGAAQMRALVGLDIDVINALAKRMQVTAKIVPWSWFKLEEGLLGGSFDLIVSSWTPTARTPEAVAASKPYLHWGLVITVRGGDQNVKSFADLEGKRVGHYRDPAVARSLAAMGKGVLVPSDDGDAMFTELKAGKLDAVIFDSPYVRWRVAGDPRSFRVVGEPLNKLGYHVGVRKADTALLAEVQKALDAMAASGELDQIRRKWESASAPR